MAEGRPAPDGWRTEPALPHRGCPCPAFRRAGHGTEASPGGVTSPRGSERWGGWRSLPPESGGRSCYQVARSGACIRSGGEERRGRPPGRALRNIHPSGDRPAAGGCDAGARSGLVRRVRRAAVRRSPSPGPGRPPAGCWTAGCVTPCPGARSARGQPGFRRCRMPHWSRSPCRPRRSQPSLSKVSFCRGREPSVSRRCPSLPESPTAYCFPPLIVINHGSLRVMDFFWMHHTYAVAPAKKGASGRDSDGHR